MQHMVDAVILPGTLEGKDIPGVLHHTDEGGIPALGGADGAQFALGKIAADRTFFYFAFGLQNSGGKFLCLILRQV